MIFQSLFFNLTLPLCLFFDVKKENVVYLKSNQIHSFLAPALPESVTSTGVREGSSKTTVVWTRGLCGSEESIKPNPYLFRGTKSSLIGP